MSTRTAIIIISVIVGLPGAAIMAVAILLTLVMEASGVDYGLYDRSRAACGHEPVREEPVAKIYALPGDPLYNGQPAPGDVYVCTEADALAQGYTRASSPAPSIRPS
jgi:hypothetical protein